MTRFSSPRRHRATLARQPSRRFATLDEIANCILFLASPSASWVVGANLDCDGGLSSRVHF
jgi:3-oxoacyl-[acyl-carrier protein] reductase